MVVPSYAETPKSPRPDLAVLRAKIKIKSALEDSWDNSASV